MSGKCALEPRSVQLDGTGWQQFSADSQLHPESVSFYIPLTNHLNNPAETCLPMSRERFAPLDSIPMYHSMETAYLAASFAFARHRSTSGNGETFQHWLESTSSEPASGVVVPKLLLIKVQTSVNTAMKLPVKGLDYENRRGWATLQGGPFKRFVSNKLSSSTIEYAQSGNTCVDPCVVSWARADLSFATLGRISWFEFLAECEDHTS